MRSDRPDIPAVTELGSIEVEAVINHLDLADRGQGRMPDPAPPRWSRTAPNGWTPPVVEPGFSVVVGRYQGTVVVTVHGEISPILARRLAHILADLIDGQGNLSLVVDLHAATISDDDRATVFADAAGRAARRGGTMTFDEAPLRPQRVGVAAPSARLAPEERHD